MFFFLNKIKSKKVKIKKLVGGRKQKRHKRRLRKKEGWHIQEQQEQHGGEGGNERGCIEEEVDDGHQQASGHRA
jgi:hypothetical protein